MSYTVPSFWSSPPSSDTEWLRAMLDRSQAYDRIAAMRRQELSDAYRCADYLSTASYQPPLQTPSSPSHRQRRRSSDNGGGSKQGGQGKPVDAECRRKMWEWCTQIVDFCKFSRETVSVAMSFLDRYLSAGVTAGDVHAARARASRKEYQLAAMTALYIAVKLNEPLEMETSLVSDLSRGCYTAREVAHMERRMLDALTWRTSDPTPMHFLRHYLALLPRRCTENGKRRQRGQGQGQGQAQHLPHKRYTHSDDQFQAQGQDYQVDYDVVDILSDMCGRQIEYAASDYNLRIAVDSSTVASAALLNALELLDCDNYGGCVGADDASEEASAPLMSFEEKVSFWKDVQLANSCPGGISGSDEGDAAAICLNLIQQEREEETLRSVRAVLRTALVGYYIPAPTLPPAAGVDGENMDLDVAPEEEEENDDVDDEKGVGEGRTAARERLAGGSREKRSRITNSPVCVISSSR